MRQVIDLASLPTDLHYQKVPHGSVWNHVLGGGVLDGCRCHELLLVLAACLLVE